MFKKIISIVGLTLAVGVIHAHAQPSTNASPGASTNAAVKPAILGPEIKKALVPNRKIPIEIKFSAELVNGNIVPVAHTNQTPFSLTEEQEKQLSADMIANLQMRGIMSTNIDPNTRITGLGRMPGKVFGIAFDNNLVK